MANITVKPHVLSRERVTGVVQEGLTLLEISKQYDLKYGDNIVATINGQIIPKKYWCKVRPYANTTVTFAAVPQGGGDNKSTLRLIAMIVLTVVAIVVAPYLANYFGGQAAYWAAAVQLVGSLAINALFRPAIANNPGMSSSESPNLSFSGQKNKINPYGVIPRIYGTHRFFPYLAGIPYTRMSGKTQYLYMIFDFGYGPLKLQDLRIGETPIDNYEGVRYNIYENWNSGDALEIYTNDVAIESIGAELTYNTEIVRTTAVGTKEAVIDIVHQGLAVINDDGSKSLKGISILVQFRKVGDTIWNDYVDANYDFSIPELIDQDSNFKSTVYGDPVYIQERDDDLGWGTTDKLVGYEILLGSTTIEISSNVGWTGGSTWIVIDGDKYTITSSYTAGSGIQTVGITPALKKTYSVYGTSSTFDGENYYTTIVNGREVDTTRFNDNYYTIRDKTTQPFVSSLSLMFDEQAQYEIKLKRLTTESTSDKILEDTIWQSLQSVGTTAPINYEETHTIVEMRIKATDQLSGVVDTFNAIATSYLDAWDGSTWNNVLTNNPAWIAYDILNGSATKQQGTQVDLDAFKAWADYCNLPAPQDATKPYLACNVVIDYNTTVFEVFQNVASSGRAAISTVDAKYSPIIDKQQTVPVQMFTPENSSGFSANRTFIHETHGLKVKFVDPDSGWQIRDFVIYMDGYNETNAVNFEELQLFGVTDYDQAWRDGHYFAAQAIHRQETYTLETDIESIVCQRGDLITVAHDIPKVGGKFGRFEYIANNGDVKVTEPYQYDPNITQMARFRKTDGTQVDATITGNGADEYFLDLDVDPNTLGLEPGDLVIMGEATRMYGNYIVKEIHPKEDLSATISFVDEAPAVYNSDTGALGTYSPTLHIYNDAVAPPAVTELAANQIVSYVNRQPALDVELTWNLPTGIGASLFEIHLTVNKQTKLIGTTAERRFTALQSTDLNNYEFADEIHKYTVVAVAYNGEKLGIADSSSVNVLPYKDSTLPGDVQDFEIDVVSETIQAHWRLPDDPDIGGFLMRYTPETTNPQWEYATDFITGIAYNSDSVSFNARVGSYLIKAYDTSGNFSQNAAIAITTVPSLAGLNFLEKIEDAPTWSGTKTNCEVNASTIQTSAIDATTFYTEAFYEFVGTYDVGAKHSVRCSAFIEGYSIGTRDIIANWDNLTDVDALAHYSEGTWYSEIQYSVSDNNVDFSPWRALGVADIAGRYFKYRIKMYSYVPQNRVIITSAYVNMDVPDRVDGDNDLIAGIGGLSVTYSPAFLVKPALQITQDDWQAGDYYQITSHTSSGFTITFYNSGTAVTRQFDWVAKGYGLQLV